jgi:hypothetical protein
MEKMNRERLLELLKNMDTKEQILWFIASNTNLRISDERDNTMTGWLEKHIGPYWVLVLLLLFAIVIGFASVDIQITFRGFKEVFGGE